MIRHFCHRLICRLWSLALRVFFRRVEVQGLENIPPDRPLLIVANHVNAFIDALVIKDRLPRPLTLTVKSTLKKNPLLRFLIWATEAIEFQRAQDGDRGALLAANAAAMDQCRRRLRAGAALCVFPEGVSHSDPQMRPLKQGATRIALDFVEQDGNPGGLLIVPAGLNYERKDHFRSRVALRFGEPIDVALWRAENPGAPKARLTEEIDRRVRGLSLNFSQWREAARLRWAAELLATAAAPPPPLGQPDAGYLRRVETTAWLKAGYERLLPAHQQEIDRLSERLHHYRARLRMLGIVPAEVYLPLSPARALLFLLRELELLLIGLPLAAFGALNHFIPYQLVKRLSRRLAHDADQRATQAIFPGIVIFLCFYALLLSGSALLLPAGWALLYAVALPYCGWYCVLWRDRAGGIGQRSRTFFRFLFNRSLQAGLAAEGRAIIGEIRRLENLLPEAALTPGGTLEE